MNLKLVLTGVLVVLTGISCTRRSAVPVDMADVRAGEGPDQESWDLDMLMSEDGRPRLRLRAPYMSYYDRTDSTYMMLTGLEGVAGSRVNGIVFGVEGDTSATVQSDRMTWFEKDRRMEARGNVIVHARNGRVLESEHLVWLEPERLVRTDGYARITLEDGLLEGYGLVARENLDDVRMANVTGNVTVADS